MLPCNTMYTFLKGSNLRNNICNLYHVHLRENNNNNYVSRNVNLHEKYLYKRTTTKRYKYAVPKLMRFNKNEGCRNIFTMYFAGRQKAGFVFCTLQQALRSCMLFATCVASLKTRLSLLLRVYKNKKLRFQKLQSTTMDAILKCNHLLVGI